MKSVMAAAIITTLAGPVLAQHHHEPSPYAGMQQRAVKALTDQQIADLKNGRGMGLALAGELNFISRLISTHALKSSSKT
jgi:hypothetical protein